ncbi:hypothetical protein K2Q08_03225 [Patescibacteria group bacterium]|nr:hypothetical protein [Patescibacteria group bacterium]
MAQLVATFNNIIINPLLILLFAAGLAVFVFGIAEFFFNFNIRGDEHAKEDGKNHMLWGLIGMFVMASALGIIAVIQNTVNSL